MNASVPRRLCGLRQDVDLACHRFADTVVFYRDRLGLPAVCQWHGIVRLDGGHGRWLTLWRADPATTPEEDVRAGRHSGVCFEVADLIPLCAALRRSGLTLASEPCRQPWGAFMVNLIDPDGRLVTLIQQRDGQELWRAGAPPLSP